MKQLKTYEMVGFNEVQTSTTYCGVKVTMNFRNGNIIMGRNAYLQTDNQFAQDAIENDYRFKYGNIKLTNTVNIDTPKTETESEPEPEPEKTAKPNKKKKAAPTPLNDITTINQLDDYFAEKGITLESSSPAYIQQLCQQHNITLPNLKLP